MKKVTVMGGGTGTYVVLSGLKKYPIDLACVVSMMDSGGSTGKLRDQLGVLPPGDLRQCLLALSEAPLFWRKLFLYRFESGDFKGHNFGNIFLSALEKTSENYSEVIKTASYVLKTKGKVFPITFKKTQLCCEYENGKIVVGEANIDENFSEESKIKRAFLDPQVEASKEAIARLKETDVLIIGPGDLYTSIIPILLVSDVKKLLEGSSAKIIYILNLMTKSGQTTNYSASEHVKDLTKYLGKTPDVVVINNGEIPENIIKFYEPENQKPVNNDLIKSNFKGKVIASDIVDGREYKSASADILVNPKVRSILRHDSEKLAQVLANAF